MALEPDEFAARFVDFIEAMQLAAARPLGPVSERLRAHLGSAAEALPVTTIELPTTARPNLQLALDDVLAGAELVGFRTPHPGMQIQLAQLIEPEAYLRIKPGPPQYTDVEVGDGRVVRCVTNGLYLGEHAGLAVAVFLTTGENHFGGAKLVLEVITPGEGTATDVVRALRAAMRTHNVYRGKTISLHGDAMRGEGASVGFHAPPVVTRGEVILPDGTLDRLERHAIGVVDSAERLRAAGRHLKRGVLLHGPPGTGKTLSVSYLLTAMPGRTVVLLTGRGLAFIEHAFELARELAPATIVLEDIDLVAPERTMMMGDNGLLFSLLTQMEGLADDEDLLFLLTTNRPDLIEPALAARPGRVDLALEIPLPDAEARGRLLRLFLGGAPVDDGAVAAAVEQTEGVSGAFIRELVRQAALTAALGGRDEPSAADLATALAELTADRAALTRRLLGEPGEAPPEGPVPPPGFFDADEF